MKSSDDTIGWLLEVDNPPVRYLTLTELLGKSPQSAEVRKAKSHLMDYEATRGILAHGDEFWGDNDGAYQKYRGKFWQLIFLGWFLADGRDADIAKGVEGLLASRKNWIWKHGGQCLTANLLAAMMRLGHGDAPAVKEEVEALAGRILADGGIKCGALEYSLLARCHMARPKILLCFAQVPPTRRSKTVQSAIRLLAKDLLEDEVYCYVPENNREWMKVLERQPKRADLPKGRTVKAWIAKEKVTFMSKHGPGNRKPKPGWLKFGFPLHYNSDALEAMYALARLDVPMSPKLTKPLHAVQDRMAADGRWIMESSLNGKMWTDVEKKGEPSKWLTWFALVTLAHFTKK